MNVFKVLSIDGGGIRGIVPAVILAEIEERTGKPISALFDLIAGTSAGGILALGLTMPKSDVGLKYREPKYKADHLTKLFEEQGERIFARPFPRTVPRLRNWFRAKYSSKGIDSVLKEYFGEACLSDALTQVIVTSYDIERRDPFFFKSRNAHERGESYNFPMWQAARATSSAPTYFKPFRIDAKDSSDYYALVDGGVFANNPAMCAFAEARFLQQRDGSQPKIDNFLVVSIGSGELDRPLYYGQSEGWGIKDWVASILNVVFDGVDDTVHYQLKQLLPPKQLSLSSEDKGEFRRYYRLQKPLREANEALDDASPRNTRALRLVAQRFIEENDKVLQELCGQLKALVIS